MDETRISADSHRVLRGLFLALLALAGGLFLSLLLAGSAAAAEPPAAPALLGEVVDDLADDGVETVTDVAEETIEHAPVPAAAEPVVDAVAETADTVAETAEPVVETAEPVVETAVTVTEAAGTITEAAADTVTEAAPEVLETVTDVVASVGAAADEVLEETPLGEALPSVEKVVRSASSAVTETVVEPLVTVVEEAPELIDPLPPLPAPVPGSGDKQSAVEGESAQTQGVAGVERVPATGYSVVPFTGFSSAPDAGGDGFAWPDDIDVHLASSAPSGPELGLPTGSSGASAGGSGANLLAAFDVFPTAAFLDGTSSDVENDDVPAAPTYESDTTPD